MRAREALILYYQELRKRSEKPESELIDESFPEQAAFVRDQSTFVAAQTTRRGGKTNGLCFKFYRAGRKYPNVMMPYIALTRDSAKNIMWPILCEVNKRYNLGAREVESSLEMILPNKSVIKLFGADQKNFIERLRGIKTPFAAIDEGQSFRVHIESLVDDILTPAISDYDDGQLALTGTPGPVPKGYFYEVCQGKFGFSKHFWTVYQNPYMPRAKSFVESLMLKKNWDEKHPTYLREWLGQWVADTDALVYKFSETKNTCERTPSDDLSYVIGVDLGYDPDPSAFVVTGFTAYDPTLYVVETYKQSRMVISDVADRIRYLLKRYPGATIIVDAADKQAVEEMKQRHSLPLKSAEKHGKAGFISLMNSDMQSGLIKLVKGKCEPLVDEWGNLIWDSEADKLVEDSRYDNHLSDAALYAWRYCYNYVFREREAKINPHSEEAIDQFWEQESAKLKNRSNDDEHGY